VAQRALVSFGMIVRNGAATLEVCLASVAAVSDELIVVDTGSDDDSASVARGFGATVIECCWQDDFSAARNIYIRRARYPWILSLDADEVLGETSPVELRTALERHPATAFLCRIHNYVDETNFPRHALPSRIVREVSSGVGCILSTTVRLFARTRGMQYCYPVHESLLPAIERQRLRLRHCAIPIHHIGGLANREEQRAKLAVYERLGRKKIARFPRYFLGFLELGQLYLADARYDAAEPLFVEALRLNPACPEAYCLLALSRLELGRTSDAARVMFAAARRFPLHPDVRHVLKTLSPASAPQSAQHRPTYSPGARP
jgi:glycosyltransferase involved in cell wall biosynthesis